MCQTGPVQLSALPADSFCNGADWKRTDIVHKHHWHGLRTSSVPSHCACIWERQKQVAKLISCVFLLSWVSCVAFGLAALVPPGSLFEMWLAGIHPRSTKSEKFKRVSRNTSFNKSSRGFWSKNKYTIISSLLSWLLAFPLVQINIPTIWRQHY